MALYKILYWAEVPTQVRAEDDSDDVTLALDPRFIEQIDLLAGKRDLQSANDYLAQWRWSEEAERPGSAQEVAEAVKAELEAQPLPDVRA